MPEAIPLGRNIAGKLKYCHYVSLLETLTVILENESMTLKSKLNVTNPCVLKDITDGKVLKENPLFKSDGSALSVILFQDAFEVVNPLGSAKKKHKVLAVYYTLGNIPPEYRSMVETLQLVLLCKEVDFKTFGQEKVFSRLITDLKLLEEKGIELKDGYVRKGSIACILGDNLGSHTVGGFVESFSAAYNCRYCLLTSQEFQSGDPYVHGKCGTPAEYDRCIENQKHNNKDHCEGIKFNSLFYALNYYHVCAPGLPPCLGMIFLREW